jgi:alpha/beta hydrolase fold
MKQLLFLVLIFSACKKETTTPQTNPTPILTLVASNSPFTLTLSGATFYENIPYDSHPLTKFDFFMPNQTSPAGLCILIHGGGFTGGDKAEPYANNDYKTVINNLLAHNVAVASINYRFIETTETEGLLKCLHDAKRALQFMRYYSSSLNFNKQKVVLVGSSAGAGTSLWIGFNTDMADPNNADAILKESTRVQGIVALSTQASYDIMEWHNSIFSSYQTNGFNYQSVKSIMTEASILNYYGVNNSTDLSSSSTTTYRTKVDMLALMSSDDPEFYVENAGIANSLPTNTNELYHHPLHLKALKDRASATQTNGIFYSPELSIDTRNGESIEAFILRKLGH